MSNWTLIATLLLLTLLAAACTKVYSPTDTATPRATPAPAPAPEADTLAPVLREAFIEVWIEDGSSRSEGACVWDAMTQDITSEEFIEVSLTWSAAEQDRWLNELLLENITAVLSC